MRAQDHLDVLLRKLETRTRLSAEDRKILLQLPLSLKRYEARQDIILEGRHNNHCCMVIEGLLCRYKVIGNGNRQILSLHLPGDVPDLQSIHIDRMDHTVGTLAPSVVGFIPHSGIKQALQQSQALSRAFWLEVLVEASIQRGWTVNLGARQGAERIAHFICEYLTRLNVIGLSDGLSGTLPLTQTEIGDALGLSTVHTNKKLRELKRQQLLEIRAGQIRVLNWQGLCQRADFDTSYLHLQSPDA